MEEETNIASIIIDSINSIFQILFSSIDTNVSSILDEVTFVNSDILDSSYFSFVFGTSIAKINSIILEKVYNILTPILFFYF